MLLIDGSKGEGGGQVLRTSLSMSMITGTPVQIKNIRAGRSRPGLMRQHLTCVKAAQTISYAEVSGAKVGSTAITFQPKAIEAGNYKFSVGTAGSTMLVLQTVLPALAMAKKESQLTLTGGTHNNFAPSFDFITLSYLPILKTMGLAIEMTLEKYGFYPQGGGQCLTKIRPVNDAQELALLDSGNLLDTQAVITSSNIPKHIANREINAIKQYFNWPKESFITRNVQAAGSGNIASIRLHHDAITTVIEEAGKIGVSAEKVGKVVSKAARRYQLARVPVGEHLADQLLLPMTIAKGGIFRTVKPSQHTLTNIDVINQFSDRKFKRLEIAKDCWEIKQG